MIHTLNGTPLGEALAKPGATQRKVAAALGKLQRELRKARPVAA